MNDELKVLLQYIAKMQEKQPPKELLEFVQKVSAFDKQIKEGISILLARYQAWYNQEGKAFFDNVSQWIANLARTAAYYKEHIPHWLETSKKLADQNWFIPPCLSFSQYFELHEQAYKNPNEVDQLLVDFFVKELDVLVEEVCGYFPERQSIIMDAVEAHKQGKYTLSIPVFFAQTDGFCYDVNRCFFERSNHSHEDVMQDQRKNLSIVTDAKALHQKREIVGLESFFFSVIGTLPKVALNKTGRQIENYTGFNRNTVLHGEDIHYGTEINSLKAFSLMAFMAGFIQFFESDIDALYPTKHRAKA